VTVLDSSVVVDYLLDDPAASRVGVWIEQQEPLAAPDLVVFEVLAALRRLAFRGDLNDDRALNAVADVGEAPIELFPTMALRWRAWELRHNFTVADGLVVALAEELGESLATADTALAAAVERHTEVDVSELV
jgi:predicted nucleic acid-binding protein